MAHLPETFDDLDESLPVGDPVVRAPKQIVVLPEPPSYALRTVAAIALVAMLIGASLGAVGLGIVYATHGRSLVQASAASVAMAARRVDAGRDAESASTVFVLGARDGGVFRAPGAVDQGGYVSRQQRIGRGRTLPAVLRSLGLSSDLAMRVTRALRPLVNMRTLQPTDVVVVQHDPAKPSDIRRVEYRRSDTQVWAVTIAADMTCSAERIEVIKTVERVATGFVVNDSLEVVLQRAGLHPDIVYRLQEVFAAIDLGRELRRGDSVRIIVEEERLNGTFFRYGRVEAIEYRGAMGYRRMFYQRIGRGGDFFDAQGWTRERGPLRAPVDAPRITSPFNLRRMHPVLHRIMPHLGVDFGAPMGAPVYAAADGIVLSLDTTGPTGNLVRLSHPSLRVETGYAHLSRFAPGLRPGMRVRARQVVGYVGSTGRSTGPHLHFSLKRNGRFIDPLTMYVGRRSVPAALRAEFDQTVARLSAELDAIRLEGEPAVPSEGEPTVSSPSEPAVPAVPTEQAPAVDPSVPAD